MNLDAMNPDHRNLIQRIEKNMFENEQQYPSLSGSTIAETATYYYLSGSILVDVLSIRSDLVYAPGFGPGQTWGSVLIHELGRAWAGHTADIGQIMYPSITSVQDEIWSRRPFRPSSDHGWLPDRGWK